MESRNNQEKGDALEMAVTAIEHAILQEADNFRDKTFIIDAKKIVNVDGVRHEIDVWVEIQIADEYDPIYIFECKNWKNKVGKNDIIVFSEKIHAVGAAKGFFVATAFTADAEAQANKDQRVNLLLADEGWFDNPIEVQLRLVCRQQPHHATFAVRPRNVEGRKTKKVENPTVTVNGEQTPADDFFQPLAREVIDATFAQFDDRDKELGIYDLTGECTKEFAKGELVIDGSDIESIECNVQFKVRVFYPRIRSYFDVERRGRFHRAEDFDVDGCKVAIGFITKDFQANVKGPTKD